MIQKKERDEWIDGFNETDWIPKSNEQYQSLGAQITLFESSFTNKSSVTCYEIPQLHVIKRSNWLIYSLILILIPQ